MLYDTFLVFAILMVAGGLVFALQGGQAPPTNLSWYSAYLVAVLALFFIGFWCRGGQTLGMRAWRIKLISADGGAINLTQALKRLLGVLLSIAPGGLGYWWQLFDRDNQSWHDRLSGTRVVLIPKRR